MIIYRRVRKMQMVYLCHLIWFSHHSYYTAAAAAGILIPEVCMLRAGLPRWLSGEESTCQWGVMGSMLGLGRSTGEGNGNPFQYSCLGNPMDRGTWWATVHGGLKTVEYNLAAKQQQEYAVGYFWSFSKTAHSLGYGNEIWTQISLTGDYAYYIASSLEREWKLFFWFILILASCV